ncbi:hypothetical protein NDU88_001429 [Pleurodeles waltl]|uniref:Uncharacterized protein n=1 Tax=Pleurodeles waltl TaxID=8319 RepID=A0AAV7Q9T1_PLEWA|nr:hypothetical protein NDU88_001429 [Pleurodeles waltl]
MGGDRTDRSELRARCKHGRLRLGKGAGKARPRTAHSGASQGGKCCVVWQSASRAVFRRLPELPSGVRRHIQEQYLPQSRDEIPLPT